MSEIAFNLSFIAIARTAQRERRVARIHSLRAARVAGSKGHVIGIGRNPETLKKIEG